MRANRMRPPRPPKYPSWMRTGGKRLARDKYEVRRLLEDGISLEVSANDFDES